MILTEEEFKALEPYEKNMSTAVRAGWARNPGSSALDLMQTVYARVSGTAMKINKGCGTCILNLLKDVGRIYFADKEERNAAGKAEKHESGHVVASGSKSIRAKKRVPVKTKSEELPRDIQSPIDTSLYEEL